MSVVLVLIFRHSSSGEYATFYPLQLDEFAPLSLEKPVDQVRLTGKTARSLNRDPVIRFGIREGYLGPLSILFGKKVPESESKEGNFW